MFGLGLGEMVLIAIVMLIVLGPKELPGVLRTVARGLTKLRRMSTELRRESGIDDILREEGLAKDLEELRALRSFSSAGMMESLLEQGSSAHGRRRPATQALPPTEPVIALEGTPPDSADEYPEAGADAYETRAEPVLPSAAASSSEAP
ncbi:MAG: hypothetical protein EXR75_14470 [Myxococcales bacterium]|nr:hypothetical protein [Myxococcales bacterium]